MTHLHHCDTGARGACVRCRDQVRRLRARAVVELAAAAGVTDLAVQIYGRKRAMGSKGSMSLSEMIADTEAIPHTTDGQIADARRTVARLAVAVEPDAAAAATRDVLGVLGIGRAA